MAKRRRVLVLAEAANPEWPSVPLVGWSHALALSKVMEAHLVTQVRNRDAITRFGWTEGEQFTAIDTEAVAGPLYRFAEKVLPKGKAWTALLALSIPSYYYFEHLVWRRFGERIAKGEYDVVHRLTPVSPTIPSMIAKRCHSGGVPFVLGPLNGGVAWPKGFSGVQRQEQEWLAYLRSAHKLLPCYRSTRLSSSAIIVGSYATLEQLPHWCRSRAIYVPENAVDPERFPYEASGSCRTPLRVAFVGRLVPYKGVDMLIDACSGLLRRGDVALDVFGDGPEMPRLRALAETLGVGSCVVFHGRVCHSELHKGLGKCDLLGFPSIREFGGGVVLEAMALGLVPIVVDYAGPAELVTATTGFKVPMGSRESIVHGLRHVLEDICRNPQVLSEMGVAARKRVEDLFTWERKAEQVAEVYDWVCGDRDAIPSFDFGEV